MPAMLMAHTTDPKEDLFRKAGDLSDYELFHGQVLVATYIRPQQTRGGVFLTDNTRNEDVNQAKVGLVLKLGPKAFEGDGEWSWPANMQVGDWVFYRASDGWATTLMNSGEKCDCRILDDVRIRGRVPHPDMVW